MLHAASPRVARARSAVQRVGFSTTRAALKRKVGNVSAQRRSRTGKLPDSSRQRASRPPKDFYLDLRAKDPRPNKSRELEEELKRISQSRDVHSDVIQFAAGLTKPLPEIVAKGVNASKVFNAMLEAPAAASSAAKHNLVRAAALQGDAATALQIVDHLDSSTPAGADQQDYANLIRAQGVRRDLPAVEDTLQRIRGRGLVPNHAVYLAAVKAFAHARKLDRAYELVDAMAADGLRPTMREYAVLIQGCAMAGQFERGWDTYIFVRTKLFLLDPEPCLYNAMIQLCGRQGEPYKAAIFLDELRGKGLPADTETYDSIMDAVSRDRETAHRAHLYFKDMLGHGMMPTRKSFYALIHACGTLGAPEQAEAYLDEMPEYGVRPDGAMVAAVLDAYRRSMRRVDAITRVEAVPATRPRGTENRGVLPLTQLESGEVVPDVLGGNAVHRSIAKIRASDPAAREAGGVEEARLLGRGGDAWWEWRRRRAEAVAQRLPAHRVEAALERLAAVADRPHYVWAREFRSIMREEKARRKHEEHEAFIAQALGARAVDARAAGEAALGGQETAAALGAGRAPAPEAAHVLASTSFQDEAELEAVEQVAPARWAHSRRARRTMQPEPWAGPAPAGADEGRALWGAGEPAAGSEPQRPAAAAGDAAADAAAAAEYDYVYEYMTEGEDEEAAGCAGPRSGAAAPVSTGAGVEVPGNAMAVSDAVSWPNSGAGGGAERGGEEEEEVLERAAAESERVMNERNLLAMVEGRADVLREAPHATRNTDVTARRMETKAHDPSVMAGYTRYNLLSMKEQRLFGGGSPRLSRLHVEPDDEGEYFHQFGDEEAARMTLEESAFRQRARVTEAGPAAWQQATHTREAAGLRHPGDTEAERGSVGHTGVVEAAFREVEEENARAPAAGDSAAVGDALAVGSGAETRLRELVDQAVGAPADEEKEVFAPSWGELDPLRNPTVSRVEAENQRPQKRMARRVDPNAPEYYEYYDKTVHPGEAGFQEEESEYDWGESTQEELEMAARMDQLEAKDMDDAVVPVQHDHYVQQTVMDRRRLRHLDGTRKTVEELAAENRYLNPDTFHAVTTETAVRYEVEPLGSAQERLLKNLPGLQRRYDAAEGKRDERLLSRVIGVLGSALRLRRAEKTLVEFEVAHGVQPGRRTYDMMVRMFADAKRGDEAFAYKREMEHKGMVPHAATFGSLLRLCAKQHDYETGLRLLREAKQHELQVPEEHLQLFRIRAQKAGIKTDLLPPDPEAWMDRINAKLDKNKRKRQYAQASRKVGQMLSSPKR